LRGQDTEGTALPADISPSGPDAPEQTGDQDQRGASGQPSAPEPGTSLPGLPRLYFPEPHNQPQLPLGQPYGQPVVPGQPGRPEQPGGMFQDQAGQRPGQPQPGRQRPVRQRSTQRPDRELRHRAIAALVFGVISLIALAGLGGTDLHRGIYLLIFSAIVGAAGCVIGITALRKARRTGTYRPRGSVGGIVLGAMAALISIWILSVYLAFPTQVNNYEKCRSLAQTSGQQQACLNQFYKSIRPAAAGPGQPARAVALPRPAAMRSLVTSATFIPSAPVGHHSTDRRA
jgi:hypothetical protein